MFSSPLHDVTGELGQPQLILMMLASEVWGCPAVASVILLWHAEHIWAQEMLE